MTPKEAIDWCEQFTDNIALSDISIKRKTLGLQAMQACKSALEKQMPKEPTPHKVEGSKIKIGNGWWCEGTTVHKCPNCNDYISRVYDYCHKCGQALDWGIRMTDNEIIKALECCVLYRQICPETCPMVNVRQCKVDLRKNTLDLINRQKAEIDSYKHLDVILHTAIDKLAKGLKAEAYREFAERLNKSFALYYGLNGFDAATASRFVNNLLKELVGE